MTIAQRPIAVEVSGLAAIGADVGRDLGITGRMFWFCRVCEGDTPESEGWADTPGEAVDAGLKHLKVCPIYVGGLDRLLADVLAVPKIRTISLPQHPEGTPAAVSFCDECGVAIDDVGAHVDHHVQASRPVSFPVAEPVAERLTVADRLRGIGWRMLAWLVVTDPDPAYSRADRADGHPGRGGHRG